MLYTPIPLKAQIEGGDDLEENSSDAVMPTVAVSDSDRKRERTNWNANAGFTWEIVDDLRRRSRPAWRTTARDQFVLRPYDLLFEGRRFGFVGSGNPLDQLQRCDAPPRAQHQYVEL